MLLYSCICVTVFQGGNMTKLKTIFLLVLAGFILVGCGDPRADEKAKLTEAVIAKIGDVENAADVAECVVGVMSDNLDDDAWTALMFAVDLDEEGAMKFVEENELDEEALGAAIESAGDKADAECETADLG